MHTAKQLFFEAPPEIHCHLLNFQYFTMKIEENIVQIRRVHSVGSNVAHSIRYALFVGSDFFDTIGRPSNVEYLTSEARPIECRIFNIRPAQDAVFNF